jgi:HTH-type transcriptional regulator, sugar sensing transcriptional regulator
MRIVYIALMDTKVLQRLGLNEKEIQVYLVLLRLGSATASKVSIETNIDRATCYRYIDSLVHKGLASYSIQNNVKYFQPAHPEKMLKDLREKEEAYKELMPELIGLTKLPKDETVAEVYKGKEGIMAASRDLIRSKKDHLVLGDEGHLIDLMPIFAQQFIKECEKYRMREKVICGEKVIKKVKQLDYKYSETRALPHNVVLPTTTLIYGNKIVFYNWAPPYHAIVITNKDMAKAYTVYFDMLWKIAKE